MCVCVCVLRLRVNNWKKKAQEKQVQKTTKADIKELDIWWEKAYVCGEMFNNRTHASHSLNGNRGAQLNSAIFNSFLLLHVVFSF